MPAGEVERKEVDSMMQLFEKYYRLLIRAGSSLQSPFLLAVRLYWGWQFMQTGWGKLSDIGKVVGFFSDLGIPAPALNAYFISALEFGGGILLILGLGSRLIALPLAVDMIVAYITADREALLSIFSNPDKFTAAAPYTFLVASLIVLIFGPGKYSLDALLAARRGDRQVQSTVDGGSRVVVQN
jgi:putative oxidoreductase